jgi:large subunit ribosomal protein L10
VFLQVQSALSRKGKEETLEKLVPLLEKSALVVGLRYQGLTVKQIQDFRRSLPGDSKLVVCKNTLLKRAADTVNGWEDLKTAAKGDNAWLFVTEEHIADSVRAYIKLEKSLKESLPKEEREAARPIDVSGGVMDGKLLNYMEVKKLEGLPTKKELIAKIARLVKQVPTKVAKAINLVPTNLAYGIKAMADADDNKELIVGDVCKPKPAEAAAEA